MIFLKYLFYFNVKLIKPQPKNCKKYSLFQGRLCVFLRRNTMSAEFLHAFIFYVSKSKCFKKEEIIF